MKQKIVIKVAMHCSKCQTKALKIAAVADGVTSVALDVPEKDKLVILGEGVDVACLTDCLRKKLCHASIEIVEEVKETPKPPAPTPTPILVIYSQYPQIEYYRVVPDPSPPCTIM